jgi:hypothetical protein
VSPSSAVPSSAGPTAAPTTSSPSATVPGAPSGVSVVAGYSSIKVSWSPAAANGTTVTGYRATASPGPATCTTDSATDTDCVLGGEAGISYTVSVEALSAGGASEPSASSAAVVPRAPVISTTPPDTDLPLDTGDGPISTAAPGEAIVVKGSGYAPYSSVTITIYSTPQTLAKVTTDAEGSFEQSVTVPDGYTGSHSFVAAGVDENGNPRALRLDVTVAPKSSGGGGGALPVTGPAVIWLIVGGFALTLAGVAMRRLTPAADRTGGCQ